jgi:hypothetical protein
MKLANHIVRRLENLGASLPQNALEEIEEMTHPDFIPGGGQVYLKDCKNWYPAEPGMRCGQQTGDDIQSGPIFCGDPAHVFCYTDDHTICCLCERHAKRDDIKAAPQRQMF